MTNPNALVPLLLAAAAGAALGAPPPPAEEKATATDGVVYLEGAQRKMLAGGTIESATYEGVVYAQKGGRKVTVPAGDVLELTWGDAPDRYESGRRSLDAREAEAAVADFELCLKAKENNPSIRDWIIEFVNAGLGDAYRMLAERDPRMADKAAAAYTVARTANAKSSLSDRILKGLAEAELRRGNPDAALKAADDLRTVARTARVPVWEIDALLVRAHVNETRKDWGAAIDDYDEAARVAEAQSGAAKDEAHKRDLVQKGLVAAARKGWVMVSKAEETKAPADLEAAQSYFESLAGRYGREPEIAAAVSNALGVVQLQAGKVKEALRLFQTTEVRHFKVPGEVARALYYQVLCYDRLGDKLSKELRAERVKDLKEFFPESGWAAKVE